MKLQRVQPEGLNVVTAYGDDYVSVNAVRHSTNLIILPSRVIESWTPARFENLAIDDFALLASLEAEVLLLGTGSQLRFPSPELLQPVIQAGRGLEVMDLQAACRTYNLLAGEGRSVAAALLFS